MITVNGEKIQIYEPVNLLSWLSLNNINPAKIAVEYNGEIIRIADFGGITLKEGDKLEIVVFMGGG